MGEVRHVPGGLTGTDLPVEKQIGSEEKEKPVLDEQTLAKLLEAAYVLQEHNRELQERDLSLSLKREQMEAADRSAQASSDSPPLSPTAKAVTTAADYTFTLAQIVETQHQIQVRHLDLENAMALVAGRITQIARAGGAAIGILDGKRFRYRAQAGGLTLPPGTDIAFDKALCLACLRTGQVFRCNDVNPEFLLDTEECRRRGIQSMIGVPIFHEGIVAGGLELYYSITHAFTEQDVHTCQLMAGLITEALARDQDTTRSASLVSEGVLKRQAVEKPRRTPAVPIAGANGKDSPARANASAGAKSIGNPNEGTSADLCQKCGHRLIANERFCGHCGAPRVGDYPAQILPSTTMLAQQLKPATAKRAAKASITQMPMFEESPIPDESHPESLADSLEQQMPELFESVDTPTRGTAPANSEIEIHAQFEDSELSELASTSSTAVEDEEATEESVALVIPERPAERPAAWSSAASARDFLERLALTDRQGTLARFWSTRRGDVSLAVAVVLVVVVIAWGIFSGHSVQATGNPAGTAAQSKAAPDANLSFVDRTLIALGLAEAPPPPENKGNPDAKVWVDLQTALYYCPADDLYGKTPKGRMTSQRSAQLDRFEPAYRKICN